MKVVRFLEVGRPAEIVDLPKPTPAPGEVLVRIAGAGVCHSDLHVLDEGIGIAGPFTLGHENAGWIAALGEGVTGWKEGDPVAVYGPWGCGARHTCQTSAENYQNVMPRFHLRRGLKLGWRHGRIYDRAIGPVARSAGQARSCYHGAPQ